MTNQNGVQYTVNATKIHIQSVGPSCDKGEGEDKGGKRGHIICPSSVLHLPVGYSCTEQGLQNIQEFTIIILWLVKTNKAKFFLFSWRYNTYKPFMIRYMYDLLFFWLDSCKVKYIYMTLHLHGLTFLCKFDYLWGMIFLWHETCVVFIGSWYVHCFYNLVTAWFNMYGSMFLGIPRSSILLELDSSTGDTCGQRLLRLNIFPLHIHAGTNNIHKWKSIS
jgi:hypothetical protein